MLHIFLVKENIMENLKKGWYFGNPNAVLVPTEQGVKLQILEGESVTYQTRYIEEASLNGGYQVHTLQIFSLTKKIGETIYHFKVASDSTFMAKCLLETFLNKKIRETSVEVSLNVPRDREHKESFLEMTKEELKWALINRLEDEGSIEFVSHTKESVNHGTIILKARLR
jgi:hypothetical protein